MHLGYKYKELTFHFNNDKPSPYQRTTPLVDDKVFKFFISHVYVHM